MLVANDWATTQAGVDALQAAGAQLPPADRSAGHLVMAGRAPDPFCERTALACWMVAASVLFGPNRPRVVAVPRPDVRLR